MSQSNEIREIIGRLARLDSGSAWNVGLNPTQRAALDYLARANGVSRSPSHLADYLGATRGTVSQTLKSLAKKGYVTECRSDRDRRIVSFSLTDQGSELARASVSELDAALDLVPEAVKTGLETGLRALLGTVISARGGRGFGICRSCRYYDGSGGNGSCRLLNVSITPPEAEKICHEHQPRTATENGA